MLTACPLRRAVVSNFKQEEKVTDLKFSELEGKVILSIEVSDDSEEIIFKCDDGYDYYLYHRQDCCENVVVEDVCGDLNDLIGTPILLADSVTNKEHPFTGPHGDALLRAKFLQGSKLPKREWEPESETWTFYKIRTIKGSVDIRWHGSSNGYYGEEVSFRKEKRNE